MYALLIGINHYAANPLYPDLRGCVRDIALVKGYLQNSLNVPDDHIWELIATAPEDNSLASIRSAAPAAALLPTYANIVKAFATITATAPKGAQVYIHYSGHGGRAKTQYPQLKGSNQSDESIVPTDFCLPGGRYLRDVEIATLLKRMTDKGLIVTLILDSCHSGGATRGDKDNRGL